MVRIHIQQFEHHDAWPTKCSPSRHLSTQVQRVQSFCVLFEGILARLRELHARTAEFVAEQSAMGSPNFPQRGAQDAIGSIEGADVDTHASAIGGTGVGGVFAPSPAVIDQTFLFAMVWGLGGGLTGDPALALDVYVRDLVQVSDNRSVRTDPE